MLHPSYLELMNAVNQNAPEGQEPIVESRYSIVLATAKRARQLVAAGCDTVNGEQKKPLSIAVEELWNGGIRILGEDEELSEGQEPETLEEESETPAEAEDAGEETPEPEA